MNYLLDHGVQLVILAVAGMLTLQLMAQSSGSQGLQRRLTHGALWACAALSIFAYLRFGRLHDYGRFGHHTYQYHDIYHYSFGAKYFRELGYYRLYEASYLALDEIAHDDRVETPARFCPTVRSLSAPLTVTPTAEVRARGAAVKAHFAPARWDAFKGDIRVLLGLGWEVQWWRSMLFDLGFNPPPSWVLVWGTLANLIPFTAASFELFPLIDLLLVVGGAAWLIRRAFGSVAAASFIVLFGNNYLASYVWTGGSYCRQPWLFFLAAGLCCLRLERPRWAGALLGAAAAFRIFPVLFLVGGAVALLARAIGDRSQRRALVEYVAAAALVLAALLGTSVLAYGLDPWRDFFDKLALHNRIYWVMHIGFPRLAVVAPGIFGRDFWYEAGLVRFGEWQQLLASLRAAREPWVTLVQGAASLSALALAARLRPCQAALVCGGTLLYFTAMPANYYYIYLGLFPAVFLGGEARPSDILRVGATFALLIALSLCPLATNDTILQNAYMNAYVGSFFVVLLASIAWDERGLFTLAMRAIRRSPPDPVAPDPA